jgi:hypothetical protein
MRGWDLDSCKTCEGGFLPIQKYMGRLPWTKPKLCRMLTDWWSYYQTHQAARSSFGALLRLLQNGKPQRSKLYSMLQLVSLLNKQNTRLWMVIDHAQQVSQTASELPHQLLVITRGGPLTCAVSAAHAQAQLAVQPYTEQLNSGRSQEHSMYAWLCCAPAVFVPPRTMTNKCGMQSMHTHVHCVLLYDHDLTKIWPILTWCPGAFALLLWELLAKERVCDYSDSRLCCRGSCCTIKADQVFVQLVVRCRSEQMVYIHWSCYVVTMVPVTGSPHDA